MNAGPTPEQINQKLMRQADDFLTHYRKQLQGKEVLLASSSELTATFSDVEAELKRLIHVMGESPRASAFVNLFRYMQSLTESCDAESGLNTKHHLINRASSLLLYAPLEDFGQFDRAFLELMSFVHHLPLEEKPPIDTFLLSGNLFGKRLDKVRSLEELNCTMLFKYLLTMDAGKTEKRRSENYTIFDITTKVIHHNKTFKAVLLGYISFDEIDLMFKKVPIDENRRESMSSWKFFPGLYSAQRDLELWSMAEGSERAKLSRSVPAKFMEHIFNGYEGRELVDRIVEHLCSNILEHEYFTLEKLVDVVHSAKDGWPESSLRRTAESQYRRAFQQSHPEFLESMTGLPEDWLNRMVEAQVESYAKKRIEKLSEAL